ncbi:hypothetical protein NA57DRAFT_58060 [Rhizodiscina lignyota]|uniref:CMP/dCMP-type deaminase domain-containing protein n=1 Tax=Rhizodiscina lignyota TaxID=1504668 RepID=A0A9P4I952_9PEZI|nr:hypothetical protein NA57DRAFT_58060 [Rhizodiscina lignyota]
MKTDNYLNLCLEQASLSPLHYRHGCIIVRGGKVIGRGYNDYRPGFNGGALKSGRLTSGSLDGPALAKLKKKCKDKADMKAAHTANSSVSTFVPFEGMNTGGGSHLANVPLSMHSEMMAIQSALAACSTSASTEMLSQKPCFKLSGHSKRKARLRRECLQSYVQRVCSAAAEQQAGAKQRSSKTSEYLKVESENEKKQDVRREHKDRGGGFHRAKKGKQRHHGRDEYRDQYQYHKLDDRPSTSSLGQKQTRSSSTQSNPRSSPLLVPTSLASNATKHVVDRTKHPRLVGADLYVARLGNMPPVPTVKANCRKAERSNLSDARQATLVATGSLHDELVNPWPRTRPGISPELESSNDIRSVHASRPCYRCIQYMHSVGIKRVFWTNDCGEWEGQKVRDLTDALDFGEGVANDCCGDDDRRTTDISSSPKASIFITKHEVLMLRRMMGNAQASNSD